VDTNAIRMRHVRGDEERRQCAVLQDEPRTAGRARDYNPNKQISITSSAGRRWRRLRRRV
jgi:hypothetical protein